MMLIENPLKFGGSVPRNLLNIPIVVLNCFQFGDWERITLERRIFCGNRCQRFVVPLRPCARYPRRGNYLEARDG